MDNYSGVIREGVRVSLAAVDPAVYDTKQTAAFSDEVIPDLHRLGVVVEGIHHSGGELHCTLYLPTHDRVLRRQVLERLAKFEEAWVDTVVVSPGILYTEDLSE